MKKILLIVQDEVLRSSLLRKLIQEGYAVEEASDAREAARVMYERRPQGVIFDLDVAGGEEVLQERHASSVLLAIPLIAIVHAGQEREVEVAKNLGVTSFLGANALTSQELLEKINEVIGPPY